MSGNANDLENEWTTRVTQDGSIFYQNKITRGTVTRLGPPKREGVPTSPVKNELNADSEDAVDEGLLEDDLGDQNLSVIDEEMRASQFGKAGPNGTAAAPGGVSYQAMVH